MPIIVVISPEALAIAAACCIALSSMFLSELTGHVPLLQLARWQTLATFGMTALVSVAIGGWRTVGFWQFWALAASSISAMVIAGMAYYATIFTVGPRITALLFSLAAPFALALGYIALGETISPQQGLGVTLVLGGIVLAVGVPRRFLERGATAPPMAVVPTPALPIPVAPASLMTGSLGLGVVLGVVTALGQALGTLFARPAMASGVEPFTAMALRSGVAASIFVMLAALPVGRSKRSAFRLTYVGLAIGSAFVGTTLGMSLLMAALREGDVGIVSTLSSITPVVILPMVWIRSGSRPTKTAWLGALLAVGGTALISLR